MANVRGALAEQALRARHQQAWPRNLYVYDNDEIRRATGRKLLLESPAGRLVLAAEYKGADEGPLDLSGLQFQIVADAVGEDLPAFAVQFTHPLMSPPQPWTFRLWPLNQIACALAPVELTEQRYVQLMYVLQRGAPSAGGEVSAFDATNVAPWKELAHLDDRWPEAAVWPDVREGNPGQPRGYGAIQFVYTAQTFVVTRGREVAGHNQQLAEVTPLALHRPALGAYRRDRAPAAVEAPVQLHRTQEVMNTWDRLRWDLDRRYRRMLVDELPSDDNRDMWRPWNDDGTRRWA
jgi:hypothetical protein